MKKFKKMICMLIALVMMLGLLTVTAGASVATADNSIKINELQGNDTVKPGAIIERITSADLIRFYTNKESNSYFFKKFQDTESYTIPNQATADNTGSGHNIQPVDVINADLWDVISSYESSSKWVVNLCPHTHVWEYKPGTGDSANTLYAFCKAEGCDYYKTDSNYMTSDYKYSLHQNEEMAYTGSPQGISDATNTITDATGKELDYTLTYYTDSNCTVTTSSKDGSEANGGVPSKPNTYYVKATLDDMPSLVTSYKITKIDQEASLNSFDFAWDADSAAKTPSINIIKGNTADGAVTYYYSETNDINTAAEWSNTLSPLPGTYYLFAKIAEDDCYKECVLSEQFSVSRKEAQGLNVSDVQVTYDGKEHSIDVESAIKSQLPDLIPVDDQNACITYSETGAEDTYSSTPLTYKDVTIINNEIQKHTVYYKIVSKNYSVIYGSATVTITPKEVTPIITASDKDYDGNAGADVSVAFDENDFVEGDSLTMTGLTAAFDDVDGVENTGKNVGTDKNITVNEDSYKTAAIAPAEGTQTNINNYKIKAYEDNENLSSIKANISACKAEFEWDDVDTIGCDKTEEDAPFKITVKAKNSQDTFEITYNKNVDKTKDLLTLTVTGLGNSNYYLPEDSEEMPLSKTVSISHDGELEWITTETTHIKQWSCCNWPVTDVEEHNWEDGKCVDCGYVCTHIGGEANCVDKAVCDICLESYGDISPNNHVNLKHFEAKAATTQSEGNIEYWYCDSCKKYFDNAAGTNEITKDSIIIEKLEPAPDQKTDDSSKAADGSSKNADTSSETTINAPKTSDQSNSLLWITLMAICGCAITGTMFIKKRR